jgi:hypothetical protein
MSKKSIGATVLGFLLIGICTAQPTNALLSQRSEVTLSITVTNSSYPVGSDMTIFTTMQNKSTNDVHLGDFIVSLTADSGKTYLLTQPELGDSRNIGGNLRYLLRPREIRNSQLHLVLDHYFGAFGIEWINKNVEPGIYTLKAVQYYEGDRLHVQSNLLKVQVKK